jgi:putative oxidoreductase
VTLNSIAETLGRLLLASLFILAGINKLINFAATREMMEAAGLVPTLILLPATILLELGGGLILAAGRRFAAPVAVGLAIFTLATNLFFHRFWAFDGQIGALQLSLFFKNVAIAGALLFAGAKLWPQPR